MQKVKGAVKVLTLAIAVMFISFSLFQDNAFAKITLKDKIGDKEVKLNLYGFSQFEMRGGDNQSAEGGVFFSAQRIRLGVNYFHGPIANKLFLDFNQSFTSDEGGLRKVIKDAFVAYKFNNSAFIRLGMIKTPVGMSFTIPGWNLDNVERNALDKGMVLERDFGVMLSGRLIGQESQPKEKQMKCNGLEMGHERQGYGFGYDVGVFNPAGRSSAVVWDKSLLGDALAFAGRAHYDYGKMLHVEASFGVSQQAGGAPDTLGNETEDYQVFDVGANMFLVEDKLNIKGEYIKGMNIRGNEDEDQDCITITGGYMVHEAVEALVKHYQASADHPTLGDSKLGNTYIGLNIYLAPIKYSHRDLQRHKIQFNVIVASQDKDSWTGRWGYLDHGVVLLWQTKY